MYTRITTRIARGTGGEWCQHPRPYFKRFTYHKIRQKARLEIAPDDEDYCEVARNRSPYDKYGLAKKPGICPVCLGKLRRISRGGRYAFSCYICGAMYVPKVKCNNCHRSERVWHGKKGTVCKGCGKPTKW